jgi:large subunit ribosomal protein L4e
VSVYSSDANTVVKQVALPAIFTAPIRPDVVNFVHTNMNKNNIQAHGVSRKAGHQTSAESWGTGRAVARIPRVGGGGTQRSGQGAFGNMCRSGRMFSPIRVWRKWHRKINVNQRRFAIASSVAASAVPALVMARGHRIEQLSELPLVFDAVNVTVSKTSQAMAICDTLGLTADIQKCKDSKKLRCGVGKSRNRRFVMRKGPLLVHASEDKDVVKAFRNIPGFDTCHVERLNVLQLAPGGHVGRLIVWTTSAFTALDTIYGTYSKASAKKNYTLPRHAMNNANLGRLINSDEIQSVVRPVERNVTRRSHKKNPLKNLGMMVKLNPYALVARRAELRAQASKSEKKRKAVSTKTCVKRREQSKALFVKNAQD